MQTKPTCKAIRDRLTLYLMGDLDPQTQATIAHHLAECDSCRVVADRLEPTLSQLRDALQEQVPEAPTSLSPEHRQRVMAAFRQRKQTKRPTKKRKPLLLRFHVLEMAAVLIAGLMIIGLLMPATFKAERKAVRLSVAMSEPEPMEQLEEIQLEYARDGSKLMDDEKSAQIDDFGIAGEFGDDFEVVEESVVKPGVVDSLNVVGFYEMNGNSVSTASGAGRGGASVSGKLGRDEGGFLSDADSSGDALVPTELPTVTETLTLDSKPDLDAGFPEGFAKNDNSYFTIPAPSKTPPPAPSEPQVPGGARWSDAADAPASRPATVTERKKKRSPEDGDGRSVIGGAIVNGQTASEEPEAATTVTPAEFDSVSMVKSPVIIKGLFGSRSSGSGEKRKALRGAEVGSREMPADIVDYDDDKASNSLRADTYYRASTGPAKDADQPEMKQDRYAVEGKKMEAERRRKDSVNERQLVEKENLERKSLGNVTTVSGLDANTAGINAEGWKYENAKGRSDDSRRRQNASAASGPAPKKEAVQNVPLLGDIPVTGRLMASDEVLSAREEREREGEEEVLLVAEDDLIALKPQPSPDPEPVPDEPESDVSVDDGVNDPFAPRFQATGVNPFVAVSTKPFSTFSIDVDTASYTLARNYMLGGHLPPPEAVRTEEFVNFFDYAYQPPVSRTFRVASEIAPSRFGRGKQLLKLGIKGRRLGREEQRPASLTFLIDSSGSMNQPDRLGLVRAALQMLLNELAETDQVAIIQFDNRARLILAHTPVRERETILKALEAIQCGGGTNLELGLQQAYEQAAKAFVSRGENRILLLSDGVVNLGEIATESITAQIEASRRQGLYLSVFGFGMGIYDDTMLKALATKGNGSYAFIDSETEARRVFVDDLSATLNTIAEDVKIQIQFNPKRVAEYRQLGYESRQLTKEQFRDDTVNAGEVGSGQSVTALYELDLADAPVSYTAQAQSARGTKLDDWIAIARVRYRRVDNGKIEEIEQRITETDILPSFDAASTRFRLAAGVAAFAEILRGSPFAQGVDFDDVASVLRPVSLDLHLDHRIRELVQIVETAGGLTR